MPAIPTPALAEIDAALVAPFVNSARSVFATMLRVPTTVRQPFLRTDQTARHEVSSIIGLSGQVLGSVVLGMDREAARKVASRFAGAPIDLDSADFPDAIGELCNMIAGGAKKDLGGQVYITVPKVIVGHGHCVAGLRDVPCISIPCITPLGEFVVEVNIEHNGYPGRESLAVHSPRDGGANEGDRE